jgi:hypothetical protein
MDPKMIEMNNLRVLNDYLTQTIDALSRQPRFGQAGIGFSPFAASPFATSPYATSPYAASPFAPIPTTAAAIGTDTVYHPWLASSMYGHTPFAQQTAFAGLPFYGYGVDPFVAQRSLAASQLSGWQQPWSPASEVGRQAQLQALSTRQSVLEAACRSCGIPV